MTDLERKAAQARQLENNQLLQELLDDMQGMAVKAWASTGTSDRDAHIESWAMHRAITKLKGAIKHTIIEATR